MTNIEPPNLEPLISSSMKKGPVGSAAPFDRRSVKGLHSHMGDDGGKAVYVVFVGMGVDHRRQPSHAQPLESRHQSPLADIVSSRGGRARHPSAVDPHAPPPPAPHQYRVTLSNVEHPYFRDPDKPLDHRDAQ